MPQAKQQALSLLNSSSKIPGNSTQRKSKTNTKKATPTEKTAAASSESKQPDTITQLLQSNEHKAPSERQYSPCAGWVFLLRQNWKDVGNAAGAACPGPAASAQGAQISFANDLAANNRVAAIHGTAAVLYNSITGDVPAPMPYAVSFGAYTTVDYVTNSAVSQIKSNTNTLAYGGLLNLGYSTSTGGHYFMIRGGVVSYGRKLVTA
jgi:hypothetical protein